MSEPNKFLILLLYYERPRLVRNALRSIIRANVNHQNWFLVVHDDGSDRPAEPIVHEVMAGFEEQYVVARSGVTTKDKVDRGGCLGDTMNQVIEAARYQAKPDAVVVLCDDDEIHPEYFRNLDRFLRENPKVMSCYSNVIVFDPLTQDTETLVVDPAAQAELPLNRWREPINGTCKVDISQVAWRTGCHDAGVWFSPSGVMDQDAYFFNSLFAKCGSMHPTGFVSQYKGVHAKQLGKVKAWRAWTEKNLDREEK